jgi:hypothetical protein
MSRIVLFFIGAACGTAVTATAYQTHIVQTNEQWLFVPRTGVTLKDIYADVRRWTRADWRAHPELVRDLVKSGHAEIIKSDTAENGFEEPEERLSSRDPLLETDNAPAELPERLPPRSARRIDDFEPASVPE